MEQENSEIITITKKDGKKYSIRKDRRRYFFPNEWNEFINSFKNDKHRLFFLTLLHTGARTMEALHLTPNNFDFRRETITFKVVKFRAANKKLFSSGKRRTFFVSKKYLKQIKRYINKHNIKENEFLFLNNKELPKEYINLNNKEKKKYYTKKNVSYHKLLKRHIKKIGVEDYYNFSLHNIRKTYGNWMRLFLDADEICYRIGNDRNTFLAHYGSSLLFDEKDKIKIKNILGEVK